MRPLALYFGSCVGLVVLIGAGIRAFTGPAAQGVLLVSAILAVIVQLFAFALARQFQKTNVSIAWGLGSVLRLVSLVLYALVAARLWRAQLTPALLSFVTFLFVTMVIEPVFLKR